jgi:hypothetical protein
MHLKFTLLYKSYSNHDLNFNVYQSHAICRNVVVGRVTLVPPNNSR